MCEYKVGQLNHILNAILKNSTVNNLFEKVSILEEVGITHAFSNFYLCIRLLPCARLCARYSEDTNMALLSSSIYLSALKGPESVIYFHTKKLRIRKI